MKQQTLSTLICAILSLFVFSPGMAQNIDRLASLQNPAPNGTPVSVTCLYDGSFGKTASLLEIQKLNAAGSGIHATTSIAVADFYGHHFYLPIEKSAVDFDSMRSWRKGDTLKMKVLVYKVENESRNLILISGIRKK